MKYILFFTIFVFNPVYKPPQPQVVSSFSAEFDSLEACQEAAKQYEAQLKTGHISATVSVDSHCYPKS